MQKITCDFAVVGAGPAGLAAAVEAARGGLQVALFEKAGKVGGIREGGMGPFAVESRLQKAEGENVTRTEAFNFMMEHAGWKTPAALVSAYINLSADTIDWLQEMGVRFGGIMRYYPGAKATVHTLDFAGPKITDVLWKEAERLGVELYLHAPVERLCLKDGRIIGAEGTDTQGEAFSVEAPAVLVAAGGFAGDNAMVQEMGYTKDVDIFYTFEMPDTNGDGLRMVWAAGGRRGPRMMDTYVGLTKGYGGPMGTAPALAAMRQFNLMVNAKGERFMREDLLVNPAWAGNAVHAQPSGWGLMILDETFLRAFEEEQKKMPPMPKPPEDPDAPPRTPEPFERFNGIPVETILRDAIGEGCRDFFIAGSLAELAEQAGLPADALAETVERYNRFCAQGEDPQFHKAPEHLRAIQGPRFFAARFFCDTYGGLGGVCVNDRCQVLDEQWDAIPGLYCAGNDANTIFGNTYPFYMAGNTSGFALNTGRLAGRDAIRYLGKKA